MTTWGAAPPQPLLMEPTPCPGCPPDQREPPQPHWGTSQASFWFDGLRVLAPPPPPPALWHCRLGSGAQQCHHLWGPGGAPARKQGGCVTSGPKQRAGERREQSQIPGRAQPRAVPAQGPPGRQPPPACLPRSPWLGLQSAGRPAAPSGRPTSTLQLRLRPESLAGSEDRPARRRQRSSGAVHPADRGRAAGPSSAPEAAAPAARGRASHQTAEETSEAEEAKRFSRPPAPRRRPGARGGGAAPPGGGRARAPAG